MILRYTFAPSSDRLPIHAQSAIDDALARHEDDEDDDEVLDDLAAVVRYELGTAVVRF